MAIAELHATSRPGVAIYATEVPPRRTGRGDRGMDAFTRLVAGYGMLDDDSALQEGAAQGASTVRRRREPVTKLGHDAVPRGEADEEKA